MFLKIKQNMNTKSLVISFAALSIVSCTHHKGIADGNQTETTLNVEYIDMDNATAKDTVLYSDYLTAPKVILLDRSTDCVIREIYRMDIFDSIIYILDTKSCRLMTFDMEGRYLRDIGKRGNGNGEYISLSDFSIDHKNKFVYLWDEGKGNALKYDLKSGKFISKIHHVLTDGQSYEMAYVNDRLFVNQTSATTSDENYMIKEIDLSTGKSVKTHMDANKYNMGWNLPLRNKCTGISARSSSNPKIVNMFADTIMTIGEDGFTPAYCLKSGIFVDKDDVHAIMKKYQQDGFFDMGALDKTGKIYGMSNYLELGDIIHLNFLKGGMRYALLYDTSTKKTIITKAFGDDFILNDQLCYLDLCYSNSSSAVAILQSDVIPIFATHALKTSGLNSGIDNHDALSNLSGDSGHNPILFVYGIR